MPALLFSITCYIQSRQYEQNIVSLPMLLNDWVWKPPYFLSLFFFSLFNVPFLVCFPIRAYSFPILSALPVSQELSYRLFTVLAVTQVWRDFWSDLQIPCSSWQASCLSCCCRVFQTAALSNTHFLTSPANFLYNSFLPLVSSPPNQKALAKKPCRSKTTTLLNSSRFWLTEKLSTCPSWTWLPKW